MPAVFDLGMVVLALTHGLRPMLELPSGFLQVRFFYHGLSRLAAEGFLLVSLAEERKHFPKGATDERSLSFFL